MHDYLVAIPQLSVTLISQIKTLTQTTQMIRTFLMHRNNLAFIHKANTNIETPLANWHDFDNQDALTFADKYTALLQQELQNPYWCLYDPVTTKSYQISKDMDIETCHTQCISLATQIQSQRSITYHIKQ